MVETGSELVRGLYGVLPHVWDVRAGEIVSFRQFVDGAAFLEVVSTDGSPSNS